jgi:hypothetical protein
LDATAPWRASSGIHQLPAGSSPRLAPSTPSTLLNMQIMLVGKGLAGYTTTPSGQHLAFAIYVNHVALPDDPDTLRTIAGEALGVIASAVYSLPIDKPSLDER